MGILSHSGSHRAEHSPPLSLHLSIRWNFYFSTICVHFPMPQRAIGIPPVTFGLWFLKPEACILCQIHFSFLPCPLTLFPSGNFLRGSRQFQPLPALWWFGKMSLKMTWRNLFKGHFPSLKELFQRQTQCLHLQIIPERTELCPVWMLGSSRECS